MLNNFFKDLKVIELASVLAGPAVGMFFAELGAQVTKVENKTTGGDVTRGWRLPKENKDNSVSAYYCSINWNKQVLMLDLKKETDRLQVLELIKEADVLIANFRKGSAEKLGMDYAALSTVNPGLIYGAIYGFGADINRPAFDVVLQAETGFLYMNGEPGRPPVKMPVALIDILAAHQLKEGLLIALLQRERTGKGAMVSTSLLEAAIASLANQATNWLMVGHIPEKMGCRHPNIAPYGDIFYTKDKKALILAVGTEKQFVQLAKVLGQENLATDPLYSTNTSRVANREILKDQLEPLIVKYNRDELLDLFHQNGIPGGSIRNMKEVFELEQAQNMILEEEWPNGLISKRVKTVAFKVN